MILVYDLPQVAQKSPAKISILFFDCFVASIYSSTSFQKILKGNNSQQMNTWVPWIDKMAHILL